MKKITRILIFFLLSIPGLKSQKYDQIYDQMHAHCEPCDLEYNKSLERGEASHCEQIKNTILLNECYIRVKCGNLPKRQEHIAHFKQEYAKYNCDDWAELNKIPPDDHCNQYQKLLSIYKRDRQGLEDTYGKEETAKMISRLEEDIAFHCSTNTMQRSSQNSYAEQIEQGQARKAAIVIETQNYLSASQAARREYNEQQLKQWKQDLEKYNGASIGSESSASYYEEKYTDTKSSERIAERLLNHKLDDDEFSPGDILAAESDNVFIRVSEEEIKRRIEQAKEEAKQAKEEAKKERCLQADDHYDMKCPIELRVDAWNNPLDQSAMSRFLRNNGTVLYQENGLIFRYLISRAVHEDGRYYRVCAVDTEHPRHTSDRNLENDGRVFYFYNLYWMIENTSNTHTVMFNTYPCIQISMTGTDSFDMCDECLCTGSYLFGNSAKLSISSSPHIMHPSSSLVEFDGAWYPAKPKLEEWSVGRFYLKPFNQSKQ
jgi:hypothetical protein